MTTRVFKAGAGRLFGIGLTLGGFFLVLSFVSRALLSPPLFSLPFLDGLPQLPLALLGVVSMVLGALIVRSQTVRLETEKRRREDARRRVQHYRMARIEPTF